MQQQDELTERIDNLPRATATGLRHWYAQGARSAVLRAPHWEGLRATPALIALLTIISLLLQLMLERLYIDGPATFYWQAIAGGWLTTAVTAWACYLMRPHALADVHEDVAPSAAHLLCMMLAQSQIILLAVGLLYTALIRTGFYTEHALGSSGLWAMWLTPLAWAVLAQLSLLSRSGAHHSGRLRIAALALLGATALHTAARPPEFWYPTEDADTAAQRKRLKLTQDLMEAQPELLAQRLKEIRPQRPGKIDLFAISFAPYADEDVFKRESEMVSGVMAQRFDAAGRVLQLVNHVDTVAQWPWATPKNLQRAIQRFGMLMDHKEDVLFLHLSSHGARNGELAADFWPMTVSTVKPAELKAWLDAAGIRHRVISISACYSGSWIDALADDNTLIMTAADAQHTSYGCGRGSELTYFGRALYDEQLRTSTRSFEAAHAAAREIIKKREEEAGKSDGYSNPQIRTGAAIRKHLARLQDRLDAQKN